MLGSDLMRHCLRLDLPFHKSPTPGELIERIDSDVTLLANFFSQFTINILGNALLVVGILVTSDEMRRLWAAEEKVEEARMSPV